MNLEQLAQSIIDVQPETHDPDSLISFSAQPDNIIVRTYFSCPHTGVSVLSDYTDNSLAGLFSACNDLPEATEAVHRLYRETPLDNDESRCVRTQAVQAILNSTYKIANNRDLGGCHESHKAITCLVVQELISHLNTFQQ